jgi:hypothetical protein
MPPSPDALLDRAMQETGLSDFGLDGWQDAYTNLVGSIAVDLGDDPDAVALVEAIVVNRLVRRLQVEQWYSSHAAEAAAHSVEGPLMIIGTGRSGTTACHHLLSLDPQFRTLRKWEINDPVPPPVLETEHLDPRRPTEVVAGVQHITTVDGPTEDRKIRADVPRRRPAARLRSHSQWWLQADHSVAFPYHERILRLLHSHRPPYRWLLKSPDFLHYIEPAVAQYPDMKFVMTHRDPLKVVPSACSVTVAGTRHGSPWHPGASGACSRSGHRHPARHRIRAPAARFLDVGQPGWGGPRRRRTHLRVRRQVAPRRARRDGALGRGELGRAAAPVHAGGVRSTGHDPHRVRRYPITTPVVRATERPPTRLARGPARSASPPLPVILRSQPGAAAAQLAPAGAHGGTEREGATNGVVPPRTK